MELDDGPHVALNLEGITERQMEWYEKLRDKLGLEDISYAMVIHGGMYESLDIPLTERKQKMYLTESLEAREFLVSLMDKISENNLYPDF